MSDPLPPSSGADGGNVLQDGAGPGFLSGNGEMATLMRRLDWRKTGLGPIETWPQSLRTAVGIMLSSRYAMFVWWGRTLINLYNDAYRPFLGKKHPEALGQSARVVWSEIWDQIGPRTAAVLERGESTFDQALLLPMDRHGYLEETYFTFSYSPIRADDGGIGGIFCAVTEETFRVIDERRLKLLRDVGAAIAETHLPAEVCAAAAARMARERRDLPFALLYLSDDDGRFARLVAQVGDGLDAGVAVPRIDLAAIDAAWPLAQARAGNGPVVVEELHSRFAHLPTHLPTGAWDRPPSAAVVVPLAQQGQNRAAGFLVAGLNPYRVFGVEYRGFISLLAAQIAAGIANARAYEEERRRAEALAEIDLAKTAFFSNVSHEFRTPLTLMLGPLEDTLNDASCALPDVHRARLEVAHRNSLRLLRLVNTLLDFSRIEAGRMQASYAPTDLAMLTAHLAANFSSAAEQAGLELVIHCSPLPELVHVDADMWEKVVLNLLSNAFKFTFQGRIQVTLSAANGSATLTVQDTGVGIPEHELPRVFERFHRIEGQRSRSFEGSGIGLALVQELVRLHGGIITAQSKVGEGTVFTVTIPFGTAHLPADRMVPARAAAMTQQGTAFVEEALRWLPMSDAPEQYAVEQDELSLPMLAGGARPRIVVAEDNADMRDYLRHLLRRSCDVVAATDGQAALDSIRRSRPDLVLSDVMMPGIDGFALLRAIRADPDLRDLPVILLSARAGEEARAEGLEIGADDYLIKPFAARELLARVTANLKLAQLRREVAQALRETNDQLELRVAERTADLQRALEQLRVEVRERERVEEAFRQLQKMEAVGQLTGGVAHDFNNLLTAISGGAETLERLLPAQLGANEPRIRRSLQMVIEGARRAATLTQRLLAFARRQALDPRPLDANRLVAGMSELLHRTLGESIAIETVLAGGLWRTMADANQLENAILNLAVNARDAMRNGGKLTIETANVWLDEAYASQRPEVAVGPYVLIAVADTGCGMTQEVMLHVFEPFFTTKEAGHGTGLGLSQVYGFIKQSNGHVSIYSEPGQGTVVKLYLPRLTDELVQMTEAEVAAPRLPAGAGEAILVVEDDEAVRAYSVETLRELGYRLLMAPNGAAGLEVLARNPSIRLLFTDIGLPGGMTGRQLADAARRLRPDLKVLFTTGYSRNAIVHGGILEPGTQVLPKPFTYAALAAKIRALLDA